MSRLTAPTASTQESAVEALRRQYRFAVANLGAREQDRLYRLLAVAEGAGGGW